MEIVNNSREMDFNSSLFFSTKENHKISEEDYKESLINNLQPILDKEFSVPAKTKIFKKHNRINFCCPYCADSAKNIYAKRGNFILSGKYSNYFKCWNCGIFKKIDDFFKDFGKELDLNTIEYINDNLQDFNINHNSKYDISLFLDTSKIDDYSLDRDTIKKLFSAIDIKGTRGELYLRERLQFRSEEFLYNEKYIVILNLTKSGKILGAQLRLFQNRKDKYRTYKLSKLYEELNIEKEIPQNIDDISTLFGIMNLDFNKPINLFEGPLDSFLIKNSIAIAGAHKGFVVDLNVRWIFDCDKTGTLKAIDHINNKETVFLWAKYLDDCKAPYREKWDINDLFKWAKINNVNLPKIDNYFSNDPIDLIDI